MNTWNGKPSAWYRKKEEYHHGLWDHVHHTIREMGIKSILEIGGGPGRLSPAVENYTCVDVAESSIELGRRKYPNASFVHADWLDYNITPHVLKTDMVLALAVIEHVRDHDQFLRKILHCRPRVAIVSYFKSLNRRLPFIRERVDPNGNQFVECHHKRSDVEAFLEGHRLAGMYSIMDIRYGRQWYHFDSILTIKPSELWRRRPWTREEELSTC